MQKVKLDSLLKELYEDKIERMFLGTDIVLLNKKTARLAVCKFPPNWGMMFFMMHYDITRWEILGEL